MIYPKSRRKSEAEASPIWDIEQLLERSVVCEAGDIKMDKAHALPGNVHGSVGSDVMTGLRPCVMSTPWWKEAAAWWPRGGCCAILSSRGERRRGNISGKALCGHGRVRFARWRREEAFQKEGTA